MRAYYFDNSPADQRELHHSGKEATLSDLENIGVFYMRIEGSDEEVLGKINAVCAERNYKNRDVIVVSPEAMGDIYETKVKTFFEEHLHEDEEIRYIVEGQGFFDLRNLTDDWIRVHVSKGDLLILPAGIYHRFTTDSSNYIKAMRLFKEDPVWTPVPRPADDNRFRVGYLQSLSAH